MLNESPGLIDQLPIDTPRLTLRLFRYADQEQLYELHRSALVTRYAGGTRTRDQSRNILQRIIERTAETGFGALAVEEKSTGSLIGWGGIQYLSSAQCYELIYALSPDHWGYGLATEAAHALLSVAFTLDTPDIDQVVGVVYPENLPSIAVLKKLGMRHLCDYFDERAQSAASIYGISRSAFLRFTAM